MALFDYQIRFELEHLINIADAEIRTDFNLGYVVDENDYTSNLTAHIRRIINTHLPLRATTVAQKLPANAEHAWGVDACIILVDHDTRECKLCLFEAKTDRLNWDYLKTSKTPQVSHFSTQLARQIKPFKMGFAIWEQFYSSKANGCANGNRNDSGSTCILHDIAVNYKGVPPNANVWVDQDIDNLSANQADTSMGTLIKGVCECSFGIAKSVQDLCALIEDQLPVEHLLFIEGGRVVSSEEEFQSIAQLYITNCSR
ncbi:hypothetical protein ACMU58_003461 [Vibrio cholerae]